MTTKEYLRQVQELKHGIEVKEAQIGEIRSLLVSVSQSQGDDVRVQTSGGGDRIGTGIARLMERRAELDEIVRLYAESVRHISGQIDALEEITQRNVLQWRYVSGYRFEEIAARTGYSWRQVMRIHKRALIAFEQRYGKQYMSAS